MQIFQTKSLKEARACRRAQFASMIVTLNVNGAPVTGLIHSVNEEASSDTPQWTVKIIPKDLPASRPARRYLRA